MANGLYTENGFGILQPSEIKGQDFLITKLENTCSKEDENIFNTHWCNLAYSLNIPFIIFYEWRMQEYMDMGLDSAKNLAPEKDVNFQILDRIIQPFRAIHGIIVSVTDTKYTPVWLVNMAQRALDICWSRYRKPIYLYIDRNPYNEAEQLHDLNGMAQITTFINKQEGICAPDFNINAKKPFLPFDYKKWFFWLYRLNSINGKKYIDVKYNGSASELYSDLSFIKNVDEPNINDNNNEENINDNTTIDTNNYLSRLHRAIVAFCNEYMKEV